jgi:hypothetical protein
LWSSNLPWNTKSAAERRVWAEEFFTEFANGYARERTSDFWGTPAPIAPKANAHDAAQKRSNKRGDDQLNVAKQTNIKRIRAMPIAAEASR